MVLCLCWLCVPASPSAGTEEGDKEWPGQVPGPSSLQGQHCLRPLPPRSPSTRAANCPLVHLLEHGAGPSRTSAQASVSTRLPRLASRGHRLRSTVTHRRGGLTAWQCPASHRDSILADHRPQGTTDLSPGANQRAEIPRWHGAFCFALNPSSRCILMISGAPDFSVAASFLEYGSPVRQSSYLGGSCFWSACSNLGRRVDAPPAFGP